ncbi:MAG: hypothetical protein HUU06_05505 [Planctomycetaceae bacterium]|nr:hypothetical protein [Planctomycetota bacterium]NUN52230.1 hypothetical protein [Planctomycetaceae bacterium]
MRGRADPLTGASLSFAGGEGPAFQDLGFPCPYRCRARRWTGAPGPATLRIALGPPRRTVDPGPGDGLEVSVEPAGAAPWTAIFEGFSAVAAFPEGAFGTPSPDRLLVVTGGTAFLVPCAAPTERETVCQYTCGLAAVPSLGVLAVAGHDTLVGIGPGGGMWETARLSLCCLRLDSIEGPLLRGVACGTDDGDRPFEVDLRDGSHRGGW